MDEPITTAATSRAADSKIELERQYSLFAMLFALASIVTVWARMEPTDVVSGSTVIHVAMGIAAIAVLIRPVWTLPMAALSLLHVVHGLVGMPHVMAYELLWAFFGATICVSFVTGWIVNRSYSSSAVGLYRSVAPCLRIMTVAGIAAVGIARLNQNFVDLNTSPVSFALAQFRQGEVAPDWIVFLTMSILVVVDIFLAVALVVPGLRRFAVGFGTCYFAWQAAFGFGETRLLLPLWIVGLYLFTSSDLIGRIYVQLDRWVPIPALRRFGAAISTIAVGVIAAAVWWQNRQVLDSAESSLTQLSSDQVFTCFFVAFVGLWGFALLSSLIDERPKLTWVSMMIRNPVHYGLTFLMLLAFCSPYLGFGNLGRFANSGLTTGGGANNHFLIPQSHLINCERDLVEITQSNDPYLQQIADEGLLMTWFQFVNYVSDRPDIGVGFLRGEDQFLVERVGDIQELSSKTSWWSRKMLSFELIAQRQEERMIAQP